MHCKNLHDIPLFFLFFIVFIVNFKTIDSILEFDWWNIEHFSTTELGRLKECPVGYNTLDVSSFDCLCDRGFKLSSGGDSPSCIACPENSFKDIIGNFTTCTSCPGSKKSLSMSKYSSECLCAEGRYENSGSCSDCNNNFYKAFVGNTNCLNCPANSETDSTASTSLEDCKCKAGYTGLQSNCLACGYGLFKSVRGSSSCAFCGANANTEQINSVQVEDCLCKPGFFSDDIECLSCDKGFFKESLSNQTCTSCGNLRTTITTASASNIDCLCVEGSFLSGDVCSECSAGTFTSTKNLDSCVDCESGKFSASGQSICTDCPEFSQRLDGDAAAVIDDCICLAGYERIGNECQACDLGSFKSDVGNINCNQCGINTYENTEGSALCENCPSFSQSAEGSDHIDDCTCNAGYGYDSSRAQICEVCLNGFIKTEIANSICVSCQSGKYSTSTTFCQDCPLYSSTQGSANDDISDCRCDASFQKTLDGQQCEECDAGYFCPGNDVKTICRDDSNSGSSSTSMADCLCNAGFYFHESDMTCQTCPDNHYCPASDNEKHMCMGDSVSNAGSVSEDECICRSGYERENL